MAIDIYFVIDIVLNFRTAFYTKQGTREERPGRIARNYVGWPFFGKTWGWFTIDFLSIAVSAFDIYPVAAGRRVDSSALQAMRVMRVLRLIKLFRLLRISRVFQRCAS